MTPSLKEVREELATLMGGLDLNTYAYLPGSAALPSAVVLAGSPYVELGQAFGERLVRLEVWLSVIKGDNQSETHEGDLLVESAVALLEDSGNWTVDYIGQPSDWSVNNGQAYTIPIVVTTVVTLS